MALTGSRERATFRAAAEAALTNAKPRRHNAFKVELAKRTLVFALEELLRKA
jgi:xanthine dehydrogenase YagS FAD-binding subunit